MKKAGIFEIKAPSNFRGKIEEKLENWIFSQTLSRKSYLKLTKKIRLESFSLNMSAQPLRQSDLKNMLPLQP